MSKAIKSYRILSVEAKDLFGAMNPEDGREPSYSIRNSEGQLSVRKFTNVLDGSLDSMQLCDAYEQELGKQDFSFNSDGFDYTQQIVNVTFEYSYKAFNKAGRNAYIRAGYSFRNCLIQDGVCVVDGQLIAIQTNVQVNNPVDHAVLGDYFRCSNGFYEQVGNIPVLMDKSALREYLYREGFVCDGIKFVRYKRSSGSSRVGKCLFVNSALATRMNRWDCCGLTVNEGDKIDLAAWEAYISLSMSSIIDTIDIQPENILVIEDYIDKFEDEVVAVEMNAENKLCAEPKKMTIQNNIFDGESLMDVSMFEKYPDKGMLLLRNRFFKTCAFNTNLQRWFADRGVTRIDQLNGFTLATDVSQIKLVTTRSSIKYAKFGAVEQWMRNIDPTFGIVKYEKETPYFDGRYVQCHYQLLNTLQLSYEDIQDLIKPSLDYITAVRNDPDVLRYHIKYPYDEDDYVAEPNPLKSKNEIVFKLLGINDQFANTKLYYDFRDDLVKGFMRNLMQGHVLIRGNYSTIFGNGFEMLKTSTGDFDGRSSLAPGQIRSTKFGCGETVLGSRSPHINSGNILLSTNADLPEYNTYFNLTNEIVCINAIGQNIQQQLNG